MPSEYYYPISSATHDLPAGHDAWTNVGGANKNASTRVGGGRTGPVTHDDATSYISEATTNDSQALNMDWPGPIGSISLFNANFRHATDGVAVTRQAFFLNAAGTTGSNWGSVNDASLSWADTGPTDITAGGTYRPGGGSWESGDFANDATIFGRVAQVAGAGTALVTSVWGTLTYVPPIGGFAILLQLAGLSALPFIGRMDFQQFMRYLSWRRRFHRRHTLLTADEVRKAWDELKAYRYPTFFFPRLEGI